MHSVPSTHDAPTRVAAEPADGGATVTWKAPEFNGGAPIIGYLITPHRNGEALRPTRAGAHATRAKVPGLHTGERYTFTVTARTMAGPGEASEPSDRLTPGRG